VLTLQEVLGDFAEYIGAERSAMTVATRNSAGESPLHWMATLGDVPAIRLLAGSGAEISAPDHQENTPLHEAVARRHVPAAKELIACGADVRLRNAAGHTPECWPCL
jgi:ankyrin repeat protein